MAVPICFPFQGTREAPIFDGLPLTLTCYFQDIDELFTILVVAAPNDSQKITKAKYYLVSQTADLWDNIVIVPGVANPWAEFQTAIRGFYPRTQIE
jgi:hypothetical protein